MIVSVYCRSCGKITEHGQFHDMPFPDLPQIHMAGTERFVCQMCNDNTIYANEAWTYSLEGLFVLDKTEHDPMEVAAMLTEIGTIRVMDTEQMMTCKAAAAILAGRFERVYHPGIKTGAVRLEGGGAIFNARAIRYVLEGYGTTDRYGSYIKGVCREAAMHLDRMFRAEIARS